MPLAQLAYIALVLAAYFVFMTVLAFYSIRSALADRTSRRRPDAASRRIEASDLREERRAA